MENQQRPIRGVLGSNRLKFLEDNPFIKGGQVSLAKNEKLFCYVSALELPEAAKGRDQWLSKGAAWGVLLMIPSALAITLIGHLLGLW